MHTFSTAYFMSNRERLLQQLGVSLPVVLTANTQVQYSADAAYPFRQDTNFWYVTGCDDPDVLYVYDTKTEYLILPKSSVVRDTFDGATDVKSLKKRSGIEHVLAHREGSELLKSLTSRHAKIASLLPVTALKTYYGMAPNPARAQLVARLRRMRRGLEFYNPRLEFAHLRMVKSREEIAALQASIDVTLQGFTAVKDRITSGKYTHEYEIEAELTHAFRMQNAHHAYPPIVASGKHACTLHYNRNDGAVQHGGQVLIDAGAEVSRGAADISRTYAVGQPNDLLRKVHASVLELQQYALSLLGPGVSMREYEKAIEAKMGEMLRKLGVMSGSSRREIRRHFPHAASHYLGLDVHDIADYSKPIPVGAVVTVEPGIYLPEPGVGVRIEDDVLITGDGYKNLSANLSTDLC